MAKIAGPAIAGPPVIAIQGFGDSVQAMHPSLGWTSPLLAATLPGWERRYFDLVEIVSTAWKWQRRMAAIGSKADLRPADATPHA